MQRKGKKGYVYLLKATETKTEFRVQDLYKYGCTTRCPFERCKAINKSKRYSTKFRVIAFFESKDAYGDENLMKYHLLNFGCSVGEEFILVDDPELIEPQQNIVERFFHIASKKGKIHRHNMWGIYEGLV